MTFLRLLMSCAALAVLSACATSPVEVPDGVEIEAVTPSEVDPADRGTVVWGGVIVTTEVLEAGTRLDVLAYPLNRIGRPVRGRESTGRFVVFADEYLEPLDYAAGREITVLGTLTGVSDEDIGQGRQPLPTLQLGDQRLWRPGVQSQPRVSFGVGISIGN